MRKVTGCVLMMVMFFCLPSLASSTCLDCAGGYETRGVLAVDSVGAALSSEVGEEMVSLAEDMGGEMAIAAAKSVALPQADATYIPAGQRGDASIGLLTIDINGKGNFLLVVESSIDPFDLMNSYVNLYTASGNVISLNNSGVSIDNSGFALQENDDINNAVSLSNSINPSANTNLCIVSIVVALLLNLSLGALGIVYFCFF